VSEIVFISLYFVIEEKWIKGCLIGLFVRKEKREQNEEKLCEMGMERVYIKREINKSGYVFFIFIFM
jgi:hypothetical protein